MFLIKKDLIIEKINDELVIFDADLSTIYYLNSSASIIFNLIRRKKNFDKIVASFVNIYNIPKTKAEHDIKKAIQLMLNKKIILRK